MRQIHPLIVVTIDGGMVADIYVQGLEPVGGASIHTVVVDFDVESEPGEPDYAEVDGNPASVTIDAPSEMRSSTAKTIGLLYEAWAVS